MLNDLLASMGKVGKLFYDKMLARLNAGNYPPDNPERDMKSIQNATTVQSPVNEGNTYSITITINTKEAPYAGAYEWGSGEHGERGSTYPIKGKPYMIFPIEDWPNFVPGLTKVAPNKNGIFFLTHVMHPGIAPRPYIQPTIHETKDDVKKLLARDFKASILAAGKTVEVIK